jgi:predicted nucleic acid-binding protein
VRYFFDTNVLVYSRDRGEPIKRDLARALIQEAIAEDAFVVSTQVLLEFCATAQRRNLLGPAEALDLVRFWSEHDTVITTLDVLFGGLELHQKHSLSIWDAVIVQAAIEARCDVLLTEDLQHGRRFGELTIENPFREGHAAHEPGRKRYTKPSLRDRTHIK